MIRINLLPLKASQRQESARRELLVMAAVLGVLLLGLFGWYSAANAQLSSAQKDIDDLKKEISLLDKDVKRVRGFEKKTKQFQKKIDAIERLKKNKIGPAKALDDLAKYITEEEKIWLTELVEAGGKITLKGGAMEFENVASFSLILERESPFFSKVVLGKTQSSSKGGIDYVSWVITCQVNYSAG